MLLLCILLIQEPSGAASIQNDKSKIEAQKAEVELLRIQLAEEQKELLACKRQMHDMLVHIYKVNGYRAFTKKPIGGMGPEPTGSVPSLVQGRTNSEVGKELALEIAPSFTGDFSVAKTLVRTGALEGISIANATQLLGATAYRSKGRDNRETHVWQYRTRKPKSQRGQSKISAIENKGILTDWKIRNE